MKCNEADRAVGREGGRAGGSKSRTPLVVCCGVCWCVVVCAAYTEHHQCHTSLPFVWPVPDMKYVLEIKLVWVWFGCYTHTSHQWARRKERRGEKKGREGLKIQMMCSQITNWSTEAAKSKKLSHFAGRASRTAFLD